MRSSVTAAMRSTIGPIRANPLTRAFALDIMREVVAVGRAHGVALEPDFAEKRIGGVDALSPEMQASMALDLQQGIVQALIAQKPADIGKAGVEQAIAALKGEPVQKTIGTGFVVVTKDNMNDADVKPFLYKSSC